MQYSTNSKQNKRTLTQTQRNTMTPVCLKAFGNFDRDSLFFFLFKEHRSGKVSRQPLLPHMALKGSIDPRCQMKSADQKWCWASQRLCHTFGVRFLSIVLCMQTFRALSLKSPDNNQCFSTHSLSLPLEPTNVVGYSNTVQRSQKPKKLFLQTANWIPMEVKTSCWSGEHVLRFWMTWHNLVTTMSSLHTALDLLQRVG